MYFNIRHYNKWWYKALTVVMILALVIAVSIAPVQHARAVGVLTATMGAAILALLAGAGVYTVVSGMTWNDIQNWLTEKLEEWDAYRNDGKSWDEIIDPLNNKVGATVSGFLKIEYDLATKLVEFVTWLVNNDLELENNDTITEVNIPGGFDLSEYFTINTGNKWTLQQNTYVNTANGTIEFNSQAYSSIEFDFSYYAERPTDTWGSIACLNIPMIRDVTQVNITDINNCVVTQSGGVTIVVNRNGDPSTTSGSCHVSIENPSSASFNSQCYFSGTLMCTIRNLQLNAISIPSTEDQTLVVGSDVIGIPDVDSDGADIVLNPGAYPGATLTEIINTIINGILDNILNINMTVTNEFVDSQAVVVTNELPISVDTDHHLFGFQLPEFDFDFASIWHYVTDAIEYASDWIAWFVAMITAVPVLSIPLYMAFTLVVIICFIKRVIL